MGPNVYGMGRMGDFKKGPWCEIWDGLYWRFIDRHRAFFQSNLRLSMMVRLLERMDPARRVSLEAAAEEFLTRATR